MCYIIVLKIHCQNKDSEEKKSSNVVCFLKSEAMVDVSRCRSVFKPTGSFDWKCLLRVLKASHTDLDPLQT